MFGNNGVSLFDDNASMMTSDVWSDRSHQRFPERNTGSSLIARTLLPASSLPQQNQQQHQQQQQQHSPLQQSQKKSTIKKPDSKPPPPLVSDEPTYCEAYPDTNTTLVDWALFAAHRVASICGIDLHKLSNSSNSSTVERNMSLIYYGKCNGERFKNDQRAEILETITLQGILLSIFLPDQLAQHLSSLAAQHSKLKLAARQCITQLENCLPQLVKRAAQERDLLIKRILFHADNGLTECSFTLDSRLEFGRNSESSCWSACTLESINEPDLFGRAIAVIVHQVLQSASLRVKSGASSDKTKIILLLSWKTALENLRGAVDSNNTIQTTKRTTASAAAASAEETPKKIENSGYSKSKSDAVVPVPYLPNPLFDDTYKEKPATEYF